ncbi:hypothetical protein ACFOW4_14580 [Micromonospora sp. GCM10011542]|uniref:hypothetical protein n=1 Tax=Micromonospora sp. GCM10011542 TaxID=3317337 RepID=UPI00361785B5
MHFSKDAVRDGDVDMIQNFPEDDPQGQRVMTHDFQLNGRRYRIDADTVRKRATVKQVQAALRLPRP